MFGWGFQNNIRDNILNGVFNPTRPNEILSLDVTEIKLQNNTKAYLSLCVDTYTERDYRSINIKQTRLSTYKKNIRSYHKKEKEIQQ